MTLLRGEYGVCFGSRHSDRACQGFEFVGVDEGRVSKVADVNFALFGMKMTDDVLRAKAVANSSDFLPQNMN
jgi:hypothetical protein